MPKTQRLINRKPFVLVTGAAGFIAYHVIEELLRRGQPVLGLDNFSSLHTARTDLQHNISDLQQVALDCGTPFDFYEADARHLVGGQNFPTTHMDSIIHLAALAGTQASRVAPEAYLQNNVEGTLRVLEFARTREIDRLIYGSSAAVYGDGTPLPFREDASADRPVSPYAASKRAAELYCAAWSQLHGITVACVRFFSVYGPRQRPELAIPTFVRQILGGERISIIGDGQTSRDYTHVTDTVSGIMRALDWTLRAPQGTFEAFNLGTSHPVTLDRLIATIEKVTGKKASVQRTPEPAGHVRSTSADPKKSATVLGYRATIGIEAGIQDYVRWFEEMNTDFVQPQMTELARKAA